MAEIANRLGLDVDDPAVLADLRALRKT